jgi:magnesium transporter
MNGNRHKAKHGKPTLKTQVKGISRKVMQSPGSGRYMGVSDEMPFSAHFLIYDEGEVVKKELGPHEPLPHLNPRKIYWLQIRGLTAVGPIETLCHSLGLHPLSIEDIFNTYHPPKFEEFSEYLLLISKCFVFNPESQSLHPHHVALILKGNLLITFQDDELNLYDPIVNRIENSMGRIRKMPIDYLFYRLVDHALDQNFLTIDALWEVADTLDQAIMNGPDPKAAADLQQIKRQMIHFIKALRPLRQSISAITQSVTPLFVHETRLFFRDLQDHILEITELADTLNAYLIESYNLHLLVLGQKSNEAMKILTAIATIFIPLTFLVGVYGMNFRWMPELYIKAAYPIVWGVMLTSSLLMIRYFKKKKWF